MLLKIYWVMTLCCCLYAAGMGGVIGRAGAGLIAFKTIAAFYAATIDRTWSHTVYPVLAIDLICLIAFVVIALRCDRLWPLWATGCALAAVIVHIASIAQVGIAPAVYHGLKTLWAIPMQLFMVLGIALDARYRTIQAHIIAKP